MASNPTSAPRGSGCGAMVCPARCSAPAAGCRPRGCSSSRPGRLPLRTSRPGTSSARNWQHDASIARSVVAFVTIRQPILPNLRLTYLSSVCHPRKKERPSSWGGAIGRCGRVRSPMVVKNGERVYEAKLHRLKGELLLSLPIDNQDEAKTCFQQALAIARQQQAKSWELRAAMSLSRLWQRQGKREAAHQLLAVIYGWFTEGLDTADLQEGKAL